MTDPNENILYGSNDQEYVMLECNDKKKLNLHQKAELFESRINDGCEPNNKHPAEAANLAEHNLNMSEKKLKLNSEELYRYNNYSMRIPIVKIPAFWEPRPWDTKDSKMNEDESEFVKEKVDELNQITPKGNFTFTPSPPIRATCPHSSVSQAIQHHSVRLSFLDHLTEDSDTDVEPM